MNLIYNAFLNNTLNGQVSLSSDTFKIALLKDIYVPNIESDKYYNVLKQAGYEISGSGYVAGGKDITFTKVAQDNLNVYYKSPKITWTDATFSTRYAIVYRATDSLLVSCYDLMSTYVVSEGTFSLSWEDTYSLTLTLASISSSPEIEVDIDLSNVSTNAIANKTVTTTFSGYGIAMGKEEHDKAPEVLKEKLDIIEDVPDKSIEDLFK